MTKLKLLMPIIFVAACGRLDAASLLGIPNGSAIAIYYQGGDLNGKVNGIQFDFTPSGGAVFQNIDSGLNAGVPRGPGEPFTFWNRNLGDGTSTPGGLGWTLVSLKNTPTLVSLAGGPLGKVIDTSGQPDGNLFVANLVISPNQLQGLAHLVNGFRDLGFINLTIVPEPPTRVMIVAIIAVVAVNFRNSKFHSRCLLNPRSRVRSSPSFRRPPKNLA